MAENQERTDGKQENQAPPQASGSQVSRTQQQRAVSTRRQDPFMISPREFLTASPFALMRRMSEEMDRIFGDFGFTRGQSAEGTAGNIWAPAIEVAQREGNFVIHAELPGLKPEEVKVELTEDSVVIQGERKSQNEENTGGIRRTERRYGQFYRSIPLPEGANADQVRANFENGVLEVTVPVPQKQSNRRQIPVQSGSGTSGGTQKPNA